MTFSNYSFDAFANAKVENSRTNKEYIKLANKGGVELLGDKVRWEDDFLGDTPDGHYSGASGSDAQALDPAISAAVGGAVRLVSGNAGSGAAADASSLTLGLNFAATNGGLVMEARVKLVSATANAIAFIGFTDALATDALEYPFTLSGTTLTSTATNATGFLFDTAATNDFWHIVGVAGNTDSFNAITSNTGVGPTADTYQTFRIEIDSAGEAEFFIDGASVGTLGGAVTAATALTPIVVVGANSTTSITADVDKLGVYMDR